jgi:hypothetical protein
VLVPLDYYRILGLPIQATAEQLQQAHRDRVQQLPRREYSEVATVERKRLIDEAYAVLSDPEERQIYDANFLAKSYDAEREVGDPSGRDLWAKGARSESSSTPSIEIEPEQFVGALSILQELGEYELVLKLGLPILSANNISLKNGRFGDPNLVVPDIVLTVALACLELGREQWQQSQYESAAKSLETGQDLLLTEGLFANLRGEMGSDLYKLRPYRILELLALPETKVKERQRGLRLLQEMLEERGGIDGTGNDQSGLNVDDFLRFIQQLRGHLTAAEQQELFEAEARRPSAVATYLAVYALVAGGFATRQPSLIRRGKLMLAHLGRRQDVHLEQAVCALLLGQTEEASQVLELTQEREPLAFIREQSQDAPDLLPGLCLYAERWLQGEVFPHFRDLASDRASLKDYFADEQVQGYLEGLPETSSQEVDEWVPLAQSNPPLTVGLPEPKPRPDSAVRASFRLSDRPTGNAYSPVALSSSGEPSARLAEGNRGSSLASLPHARRDYNPERVGDSPRRSSPGSGANRPPGWEPQLPLRSGEERSRLPVATRVRSGDGSDGSHSRRTRRGAGRGRSLKVSRLLLLAAAGIFALLFLWFLLGLIFGGVRALFARGPSLEGEQLNIRLDRPVMLPDRPKPEELALGGPLTEDKAAQTIRQWFSVKAQALGKDRQVDRLSEVLVDPALSLWQRRAQDARRDNWHWEYQHQLEEVSQLKVSETDPNQATVEAQVVESGQLFENGQPSRTREDNLRIRYQLMRDGDRWKIRDWAILSEG